MNSWGKKTLVVGFAIFAMLFGAGNLVFPPYLGVHSGTNWFLGFAGFALIDVIFTVIGMYIVARREDGVAGVLKILGPVLTPIFLIVVNICLGPLVAIPRTAATTFELSIAPLFPGFNSVIFSIIFFGIVLILCIKPSKVIDIVGSVLAPILLVTLLVLIVMGIVNPIGTAIVADGAAESAKAGIVAGYQTMDTMGTFVFAFLIISQISAYKLPDHRSECKLITASSIIAGVALILVYGGLAYLGSCASGIYGPEMTRAEVTLRIATDILGYPGQIILAVIVTAACLTTAIGLASSSASCFESMTHNKVSYKVFVTIICVMSAMICNIGLESIIAFASPILTFLYPIMLTILFLGMIDETKLSNSARYGAIIGSTIHVTMETLESIFGLTDITAHMPLASLGFAWIIPAVIGMLIGACVRRHPDRPDNTAITFGARRLDRKKAA